jgi:hypothetical protein
MAKNRGGQLKYDERMTETVLLRLTPAQKFALQKLADDMNDGNIADFIREQFSEAFDDWREEYETLKNGKPVGELVPLPDGYSIRKNKQVGVDYLDPSGNIVMQHPVDSNSVRRYMWNHAEKVRQSSDRFSELREAINNARLTDHR